MLDHLDMRATFFVPAYVAEHEPKLVPTIAAQKHEVGLHGYIHEDVEQLDEAANREVLRRSIGILGEQLGHAPTGYRSPSWKMTAYLPGTTSSRSIASASSSSERRRKPCPLAPRGKAARSLTPPLADARPRAARAVVRVF